jgi:hypothetical protein
MITDRLHRKACDSQNKEQRHFKLPKIHSNVAKIYRIRFARPHGRQKLCKANRTAHSQFEFRTQWTHIIITLLDLTHLLFY